MLEQEVEREGFLVAELRSETQLGVRQVRLPFLADRTRRTPIGGPVARLLVKIIVLDGSVPDIGTRDNVHEHIVADFEKVAEPYHGLQRLLGCRREDSRQENHTGQESLYHTLHESPPCLLRVVLPARAWMAMAPVTESFIAHRAGG